MATDLKVMSNWASFIIVAVTVFKLGRRHGREDYKHQGNAY
jgi:hypothetical protein